MKDLQKKILLTLYKEPGSFVDIKPLLLEINPSHQNLVYALKYLVRKDKLIEGNPDWSKYIGIIAGKTPKIKNHKFVFRLTIEGERIVRERYLQGTANTVGFSGNVIGDNFQNNTINITNGSNKLKTNITQISQPSPKKNNRFWKLMSKFWWAIVAPIIVGLIIIYLENKINL